jgi:epoxyqueuosine reductase
METYQDIAHRYGFAAAECARVQPLWNQRSQYQQWLQKDYHGLMGYMERRLEERGDITKVLPEAQSVIVLATNYYTEHQHPTTDSNIGKLSRYAWGTDYHDVIAAPLELFCRAMDQQFPGNRWKSYTDTGPVMEKQWAVLSGLGWQGKHSNIIRRDIGSWFFLSVVITTAVLPESAPVMDYCGTCTACIDACPTQAIVEPYVVDSRKCISHWTIEAKPQHEIPQEVAKNLDGWLYGCDVCQDVCPWNRFQTPSNRIEFLPRNEATWLPLDHVVNLSPEEFVQQTKNSPLARTTLAGLQRNVRALQQEFV